MYLHPEVPSYEMLMAARDRFVAFHPELRVRRRAHGEPRMERRSAGHLLDRFPNANVDIAARMTQIQYQSVRDPRRSATSSSSTRTG